MGLGRFFYPFDNEKKKASAGPPGPAGIGFNLTTDGDFDIQNKKLRNISEPAVKSDAASRGYVDDYFLYRKKRSASDWQGQFSKIINVKDPENLQDVSTKNYCDGNIFDYNCKNNKLLNVKVT